jgi:hypothetical protein
MAERKVIHIEPGSQIEQLLRLVKDEPVTFESSGKTFRIEREKRDPFEDYDPGAALAALRQAAGALEGIDVEAFKREIWEQRGEDSKEYPE